MSIKLLLNDIDAFVFDFDGVMTNNKVYIDQNGKEPVETSNILERKLFSRLKQLQKESLFGLM